MKKILLITLVSLLTLGVHADTLNYDSIEVSLLTCEPHAEVYSLYGHTAIRLRMPSHEGQQATDVAINYGLFDSSKPYFVLRFIFGLTDYTMGVVPFERFLDEYAYYGSAVYEQRLNLTAQEKERFLMLLNENMQPENIVYRYNFFYNNCTTKARDIILASLSAGVKTKYKNDEDKEKQTFRDLIHWKANEYPWAKMGNDVLLGVQADCIATREQREFLPEVLMKDFNEIIVDDGSNRALVSSTKKVLDSRNSSVSMSSFPLSPTTCALIWFALMIVVGVLKFMPRVGWLCWVEYAMTCCYALSGFILMCMIFSEHPTVRINFQILVLNPLLLYLCFPLCRWRYRYVIVSLFIVLFYLLSFWQHYAEGMYIMAAALLIVTLLNLTKQKH